MAADEGMDCELPAEYTMVSINALRESSRRKLSSYLDLEGSLVLVMGEYGMEQDVVNNYNGLAEMAGFNYQAIRSLQRHNSPTKAFLDQWNGCDATVGNLWQFLYSMERLDVLTACRSNIVYDCRLWEEQQEIQRHAEIFDIVQDQTVSNSDMKVDETKYSTIDDVRNGEQTFYDAFICYTTEDEADRAFVRDMIRHLELERGLKLFVPGRNDIPGSAEHTINAYLIEKRCRRVVILISKSFLKSMACDFQVKFAHALAPGARSKRLIPIVREKGTVIPRILRFLAVCDFTRADMLDWVWDRLHTAIIAPVGPITYFEEEDEHNPFEESLKEIGFPTARRLNNEEDCRVQSTRSNATARSPVVAPAEGSSLPSSSNLPQTPRRRPADQPSHSVRNSTRGAANVNSELYTEHFV